MKIGAGACAGMAIGFAGWLIGLTVVCLAAGEPGVLARTLPVGALVTAGLLLVTVALLELAVRHLGRGRPTALLLAGALLVDVGLLLLVMNHWLAPRIESSAALLQTMQRLGGMHRTTDALPAALLAGGVVLLLVAMIWLARRG